MTVKRIAAAAAGLLLTGAVLTVAYLLALRQMEPAPVGGPPSMRLISDEQYINTIHELFGEDIDVSISSPPLRRRQGLMTLGAAAVSLTPGGFELFHRTGQHVAEQVIDEEHRLTLVPCLPASISARDDECAGKFFARAGRFLYRRPLTETELKTHIDLAGDAALELDNFYLGLAYSLAGMLTAPQFLYVTETVEPDPDNPSRNRLDAYSKAVRLSFFLWNTPPDEALLAAAESGEIHEKQELGRQIDRMMKSSRLQAAVKSFFEDLLEFEKFDTLTKDAVIYPAFTREVAVAAREQTMRLIVDHLLVREEDYRDLFTTRYTFVNPILGPLYKKPVPTAGWTRVELKGTQSAGLQTALSFLALHSHPGRSSPTLRGKAIRQIFLCQEVPRPPPNVDFSEFENPSGLMKTVRERLERHSTDPLCAGCHKVTDPIGLALENFDGAGLFRATEQDNAIDVSGNFDGQRFADVQSFGRTLKEHPALTPCLASRLFAYAVGRELGRGDRDWLAYLTREFSAHEYRFPALLRAIATSEAFYAVSGPNDKPESTTAAMDARNLEDLS